MAHVHSTGQQDMALLISLVDFKICRQTSLCQTSACVNRLCSWAFLQQDTISSAHQRGAPLGAHAGVLSYTTDESDFPEVGLRSGTRAPTLGSSINLLGSSVKRRRTVNHDYMVLVQERH
ncbi:hypothetical protein NXS19_004290 [Fusarium pseudograminearum]|nr:hypothetical protein NXS19_004290 [Fusarium pseudograminearum]